MYHSLLAVLTERDTALQGCSQVLLAGIVHALGQTPCWSSFPRQLAELYEAHLET